MSRDQEQNELLWQQYMAEKKENRELMDFLNNPGILDVFRDRVLEIILAYDISSLPFVVNMNTSSNSILFLVNSKDIPDDKVKLAADILVKNIKAIRRRREFLQEWGYYNRLIVGLLPRLKYEDGQDLLALFEINDIKSYWGVDESSGYTPLRDLLWSENIDQRYIDEAAIRIHQIIKDEVTGRKEPRVDHEDAFNNYRYILTLMLMGDSHLTKIQKDFLAREIIFMLGIDNGRKVVEFYVLLKVWKSIPLGRDGRYRLAERCLNCGGSSFSVYRSEDEEVAKLMMEDFPGLRSQLQVLIDDYKRREAEWGAKREAEEKKKTDLLDKMSGK